MSGDAQREPSHAPTWSRLALSKIEADATFDAASSSLWLRLVSTVEAPDRKPSEPQPALALSIELDAAALPEPEPQQLQLDIEASGQWTGPWSREPEGLIEARGPKHSPAVRSLRLEPYVKQMFDYHVTGTLELVRAAGRLKCAWTPSAPLQPTTHLRAER